MEKILESKTTDNETLRQMQLKVTRCPTLCFLHSVYWIDFYIVIKVCSHQIFDAHNTLHNDVPGVINYP